MAAANPKARAAPGSQGSGERVQGTTGGGTTRTRDAGALPLGSLELWLDCRASDEASAATSSTAGGMDFDRRVLRSGAPSVQSQDLVHEAEGGRLLDSGGKVVGAWCTGLGAEAQKLALSAVGSASWVVLQATDGAVFVPAENAIAAGRAAGTRVAVVVASAPQISGLAGALQLGVDALVLQATSEENGPAVELLKEAKQARAARAVQAAAAAHATVSDEAHEGLVAARVTAVDAVASLADRVCLDLVRLLREGEGALVGSAAKALCFVHAETAQTGLVPPRPFRINAGPVHAYVAMADGKTKYLSEIIAGDEVLVVDAAEVATPLATRELPGRAVAVGRCKVEPRPVLCVRFNMPKSPAHTGDDGSVSASVAGQVFLQQAETVRLRARVSRDAGSGEDAWQAVAVTALRPGDEVLVRWSDQGTHVGRRIAAAVTEH